MSGYKFIRGLGRAIAAVAFRTEYHGLENEPTGGAYIAFSNHTTFFDPILTACAVKRPLYFMAKSELEKVFIMRWIFKWCNVVPVHRGESDIAALRKTCDVLKNGENVGIYPQGTRIKCQSPDPETALAGLGLMASKTKATLLPVTICYGKKNTKPTVFRKVHVYVGKPIPYEEYSSINERPNSKEIAEYAFKKLCDDFEAYNHD